jgi:hypothetical protein
MLAVAAATILVSPHTHTHDLLILMLPAALIAAHRRDAVSIVAAALLLFAVPMAMLGVNLATPMLAAALAMVSAGALQNAASAVPGRRALLPRL